jgi:hypothetical protein
MSSAIRSFALYVSHSQVAVFDRSLERPFNFWTEGHVTQGFAWRPGSASFATLVDAGLHHVRVMTAPAQVGIPSDAIRVIQVPFDVPPSGNIDVASISDSVALRLPFQPNVLRFEYLNGTSAPEIRLVFMNAANPTFEILRRDAKLSVVGELLMTASPA